MAGRNVQDGISMLQAADGAISSITSFVHRIRELTVQAGNGANTEEDRLTIQNEINQMIEGIDSISSTTEFNGIKLIGEPNVVSNKNTDQFMKMPVGANVGELVDVPKFDLSSKKIGETLVGGEAKYLKDIDVTDFENIDTALDIIGNTLDTIMYAAGKYGALENRFEDSYKIINEFSSKLQNSESSIRDTDITEEMMEYTKSSLLVEAGNAMMVQTNKFPQEILQILERVKSR